MRTIRLFRYLHRFIHINPGEETLSILFFFFFFLITAPYSIIKSIRNANLLDQLGEEGLPYAYLFTALLIGIIVNYHSKFQEKIPRNSLIITSLVLFLITIIIFWFLIPIGAEKNLSWLPIVYWIWANIYIIVLVTQFWITVNDSFNPREAKRLIGFFGSGGILGGIVGGILTGFLATSKYSDYLLLIAAAMIFSTIFVVQAIFKLQNKSQSPSIKGSKDSQQEKQTPSRIGFRDCFKAVHSNSYLLLLAGIVTVTLIVSTLIDFQFNAIVKNSLTGGKNLISFFAFFTAGMLVFSFFLQLLLTSKLINRYGLKLNLLLYPLILLFCSAGIAVWPQILFAILIKGGDKSLSFSLNQSARELLYIPISIKTKYKAKIFIDMFLNRFAKGLGAVILMVFLYLKLDLKYISLFSAFFIVIWMVLNLKVSKQYIETVKENLITKWERGDKLVGEEVDRDYTKLIFDLLESKDRSKVLYAMHLYELITQNRFTPEIQNLVAMETGASRMAAMGSLIETEQTPWIPAEFDLEKDDFLEKNIKEIMSSENYQTVIKEYIESVLDGKKETSNISKMEIAKALGLMPPKTLLVSKLDDLLEEPSPEVVKFAMESVARLQRIESVPVLINKLLDPILKEDARSSLEKFGEKISGMLSDYILDPSEDLELRKALIPILAQTGTAKAVQTLIESFQNETSDLSTDIIDAFDLMQSNKINLNLESNLIREKILIEIKKYYQLFLNLHDTKKIDVATERDKMRLNSKLMNIFKLLALFNPREDIYKAYNYLQTGTQNSMAYAIELLDNTLRKEIRDLIIPIVEDIPLKDKIHKIQIINRNLGGSDTNRVRNKKQ